MEKNTSPVDPFAAVKEFTEESMEIKLPNQPAPLTTGQVEFLITMICDEMIELLRAQGERSPSRVIAEIVSSRNERLDIPAPEPGTDAQTAEQADALVDIIYYIINAASKNGINLGKVFSAVHAANMNKRDPATGRFLRNTVGKVIKPAGWEPPNILSTIEQQKKEGSWSP